jgi:hypothetical protein
MTALFAIEHAVATARIWNSSQYAGVIQMLNRTVLTLLLGISAAVTSVAQSNPSFEMKRDTNTVVGGGSALAQGDFNNDGKPDLMLAGGATSSDITLRLGNGDGTFQAPKVIGVAATSNGQISEITAVDLNRDGKLDLVVLYSGKSFEVFYGNGDGTFQTSLTFYTNNYISSAAVADFNGDGLPDIAVGDAGNEVEIFSNLGGKNFVLSNTVSVPVDTGRGIVRLRAGDVDGNGTVDLALLTGTAAYVLWGDGHEHFKPVGLATYSTTSELNIGNLNQDGRSDILISYYCGGSPPYPNKNNYAPCVGVDAFYGEVNQTTSHRLIVKDLVAYPGQPWSVDVNGDGIADIAMGTSDTNGIRGGLFVWLGHADGTFNQTPQRFIVTSNGGSPIVPGDWNRDGMVDFAQTQPSDGETEIYINGGNRAACATSQVSGTATVCEPVDGTYSASAVRVRASAYDINRVTAMQEYVDYKLVFSKSVSSFDITLTENVGPHLLVTKGWNAKGSSFISNRNIMIYSGIPGAACAAAMDAASICLPAGATSGSPVHILANGYTTEIPTSAQLYVDGRLVINDDGCNSSGYCVGGTSSVDTYQTLSRGTHDLYFKLWDASGATYTAQQTVTIN